MLGVVPYTIYQPCTCIVARAGSGAINRAPVTALKSQGNTITIANISSWFRLWDECAQRLTGR